MILQQSPRITRCLRFRQKDCQTIQKVLVIPPVQEYLATLGTPDHDVVQDAGCV